MRQTPLLDAKISRFFKKWQPLGGLNIHYTFSKGPPIRHAEGYACLNCIRFYIFQNRANSLLSILILFFHFPLGLIAGFLGIPVEYCGPLRQLRPSVRFDVLVVVTLNYTVRDINPFSIESLWVHSYGGSLTSSAEKITRAELRLPYRSIEIFVIYIGTIECRLVLNKMQAVAESGER